MKVPPTVHRTLEETLARFELAPPVEIADTVAIRDAVRAALPDYQVEAYAHPESNQITVALAIKGVVFLTRTLVCV